MPSIRTTVKKHSVWNELDSWGLPFGVHRLPMESNKDFRDRLLAVIKAEGDASHQGLVDGLSAFFKTPTYSVDGKKHFYFRLVPQEYNASGTKLDVSVYIDNVLQTQNIEYYTPTDWMYGGRNNYVFDTGAEGFIVWRDSDGKYTNHLEFLVAPPSGTAIKLDYWAKIDDDYVHIIETSDENDDLIPNSATTPTTDQITVQQLFDSDFLDEHLTLTGVPDDTLKNIVSDVNKNYPFHWGTFQWDSFFWNINVNQGILPSYYDGLTDSGDFASGTGQGDDLKIVDVSPSGQPIIHPGYLYYAGKEYYMYRLMDYQESDLGDNDVKLFDESGNYVNIVRPAPLVVRANITDAFIVAPTGPLVTGETQWFSYDDNDPSNTVFTLTTGTPADPTDLMVKRYIGGDVREEANWVYNLGSNTVSTVEPLGISGELFVSWPIASSRMVKKPEANEVTGFNFIKTHEEAHRVLMDSLITTDTLADDLSIVVDGAHKHYVKLTDPRIDTGELYPEVWAESGNVAPILGVNTPFESGSMSYMQLEGVDHVHTITAGVVGLANITLYDDTILSHNHPITFDDGFGWLERTPEVLRHKPDPKAQTLTSPAAQTFLSTAWDNLTLDTDSYPNGYYTVRPESGSLRFEITDSLHSHTVFYERGDFTPDEDYVTVPEAYCPSLYYAHGKILTIGRHIPMSFVNAYPEKTVFDEWDKKLGITIEALDSEGLGLVSNCKITLEPNDDYTLIDMNTDGAITNLHGTVYIRPTISEGGTAITKGDTVTIKITSVFKTQEKYDGPLPSTVTEVEGGEPGKETYTYTLVDTFDLTWVGS